jgi:hypothetical protein
MLSIGVLFDFLINLAKVLGGDGGVVTASCLYFLVTASIRTVGDTPNSITGIKTNTNNQDRTYTYDANGSMTKNDECSR